MAYDYAVMKKFGMHRSLSVTYLQNTMPEVAILESIQQLMLSSDKRQYKMQNVDYRSIQK